MTAPVGAKAFASEKSKNIEKVVKKYVKNIVDGWGRNWSIRYKVPYTFFYPENNIAFQENNGKPTTINPDGGMLCYKGTPQAFVEVKYQKAKANACERVFRYLPLLMKCDLPWDRFIVVLNGIAFEKNRRGHITSQPGATVVELDGLGCSYFVNESKEHLHDRLFETLTRIKIETEQSL